MKTHRALAVSLAASLAFAANAMAASAPATEATRLTSQYSNWAGGASNAEALVNGLRSGSPVAIVTTGPDRSVSIAGFTPASSMSMSAVNASLSNAQRSLARMGIIRPNAEQIQAALIGGEVALPNGATSLVQGTIAARGVPSQVARR